MCSVADVQVSHRPPRAQVPGRKRQRSRLDRELGSLFFCAPCEQRGNLGVKTVEWSFWLFGFFVWNWTLTRLLVTHPRLWLHSLGRRAY